MWVFRLIDAALFLADALVHRPWMWLRRLWGNPLVKPRRAGIALEFFARDQGVALRRLDAQGVAKLMLEFYRSVPVSGLVPEAEADMLLVQWGVFDFGHGEWFEFDVTRQFLELDTTEPYREGFAEYEMFQLH